MNRAEPSPSRAHWIWSGFGTEGFAQLPLGQSKIVAKIVKKRRPLCCVDIIALQNKVFRDVNAQHFDFRCNASTESFQSFAAKLMDGQDASLVKPSLRGERHAGNARGYQAAQIQHGPGMIESIVCDASKEAHRDAESRICQSGMPEEPRR
jgi:hypothetical protein